MTRWPRRARSSRWQLATDPDGVPVLDVAAGPPTAPTTPGVDGEDPPSSEDWINDYAPDEPFQP